MKLAIAAGDDILVVDHIQTTVQIQHHTITSMFVVVNILVTPLGWISYSNIVIDFASAPVIILVPPATESVTTCPDSLTN